MHISEKSVPRRRTVLNIKNIDFKLFIAILENYKKVSSYDT